MPSLFVRLFFSSLLFLPATSFCMEWLLDNQPTAIYVGAFGGINGGFNLPCKSVRTNRGYYFGLNGGKRIWPNCRLEIDAAWQRNETHGLQAGQVKLANVKGPITILSVMGNGLFDFSLPFPGSPSIGGGIGYAKAYGHWSGDLTKSIANGVTKQKSFKDSLNRGGFAWQVMAQLNFFLRDDLKLNIEYRYFRLTNDINNSKFGLALVKFF